MRVIRTGFEPRRGRATSQGLDGPQNDHTLGLATRTHGSNPPRSGQRGGIHFLAPRPAAATLWRGPVLYCVTPRDKPRRRPCEVGFSPYQTLGGEHRRAFPRFEHEHEHGRLRSSEHRPLQIQPDIGRAFNIVDRAGSDVVVFLLKIPASHGFDLKPFYRLIVKPDAGTIIKVL
jgi:hypothetical protein